MLHIIAQYRQLVTSFIMNSEVGTQEGLSASTETSQLSLEKKQKMLDHRDFILDYDVENDMDNKPKTKILQEKLKDLGIKGENGKDLVIDGIYGDNTLHAHELVRGLYIKYNLERKSIIEETQNKTLELSAEEPVVEEPVVEEPVVEEPNIETKEVNKSNLQSNTFGILSDIDVNKLRDNINEKSFDKMILGLANINDFYAKLINISNENNLEIKTNNDGEEVKKYSYNPLNIGELKDIFKDNGYENEGFWFLGKEVGALMQILENIVATQKLIPNLGFKEKLGILIDFDKNGFLDNDIHFYVKEKALLESIENKGEFDNLLKNLGYVGGIADFDTQFSENYFKAREVFKKRLGYLLAIKPPIQPTELLTNSNSVKKYSELMIEIRNQISEGVNSHEKFTSFTQEQRDKITLEAVGLLVGSNWGIGASFNIEELTKTWLDNAFIGIANGIPGVGLSKIIYESEGENGRLRVDAGIINIVPFASFSVDLNKGNLDEEQFKELFQDELDAGVKVVLGGSITTIGGGVYLNFKRIDETSIEGRELAKKEMSKVLDIVFENIKDGKTFEDSDFSDNKNARIVYDSISDYINNANLSPELIREGVLTNYENDLSEGTEGFNFTGLGAGLVFISGYLPIPVILVHGNHNTRNWEKERPVTIGDLREILDIKEVVHTAEPEIVNTSTEGISINSEELAISVNGLDNTITFRTRSNKYSDEIMNPYATIDERWNGFVKFANRDLKYSKELNLTIDSFKSVLSLIEKTGPISQNDKFYIISTIVQFMKKANDTSEGSIENYNQNYESLIKMKNDRRSGYNKLLGFNTDELSKEFDKQLIEAGRKGEIGEMRLKGISFDAASSLGVGLDNKSIKGVDVFFSNIQILTSGGHAILIPITKQEDIDGFISMLDNKKNIDENIKNDLIEGIRSGNIELNYYSDPDGFDDRILPIIIKRPLHQGSNKNGSDIGGENDFGNKKPHLDVYSLTTNEVDLYVAAGISKKSDKDESPAGAANTTGGDQAGAPSLNGK